MGRFNGVNLIYNNQLFFSENLENQSKNNAKANTIIGIIAAPGPYIATESIINNSN